MQIVIPNLDKKCLLLHDFQLKLRIPVQCHLLVDGRDRMNLPIPTRLDWTMVFWSCAAKGTLEVPQAIAWDPIGKSSVSPIFRQFSNRCIMRFWFTKHLKVHSCVFKWFLEPPQDSAILGLTYVTRRWQRWRGQYGAIQVLLRCIETTLASDIQLDSGIGDLWTNDVGSLLQFWDRRIQNAISPALAGSVSIPSCP